MTIVFCFTRIFRNSHRQIFGIDKLLEQGYQVVLLDLSQMYGGNPTCSDELMLKLREECANETDLVKFREKQNSESIIYVCNDTYLLFAHKAFKILIREQDRLLAFRIKASPFQHDRDKGFKLLIKKASEKFPWLPMHLLKPLYNSFYDYYIPDYYLCSTKYYLPAKALMTVKKENIIIAHSDDVNNILEDTTAVQKEERIGVFLDQILPFVYNDQVDIQKYYDRLDRTLKLLKEHFQLDKIQIAEHPESAALVEELKDKYSGYERYTGNTQRLIKNSTYVFAHYSTSIGLAAFYEKPVILLEDENLRQVEWISTAIHTYKRMLKLPIIDMEDPDMAHVENHPINKQVYRNYVLKYMKDSSIEDKSYFYAINKVVKNLRKEEVH